VNSSDQANARITHNPSPCFYRAELMTETSAKSADCVQFTTHSALHADTHNQS